ncbi:MAG: glycosyltransferase [Planctomycetota bacterium]|jgi:hypothetical protein
MTEKPQVSSLSAGAVMMVAYYYPPMAAAGSHRVMHFSRELSSLGWRVQVVSSGDFKRNRKDSGLLNRLEESIKVRRVPSTDIVELMARMVLNLRRRKVGNASQAGEDSALVQESFEGNGQARAGLFDFLSRFLKTPDSMLSFIPSAVLGAIPWMMGQRPDVVFSSAPPYSGHLAALCLKHLFRVPWIADFRDPWTDNPFRNDNPYRSLHALNRSLEAMVVREADGVVTNTPALEEAFRLRYPHFDHFVTITNGFDPALLDRFETDASCAREAVRPIRMVHTGEVYGLRSPHALIDALGALAREDPELSGAFEISFYGKVEEKELLLEKARGLGVDGSFRFEDQVEHEKALEICAGSDLLLLLGVKGDRPEVQVPSKLYEYFALRKPILSLSKRGGAIEGILERSGVPYLLGDLEQAEEIKTLLLRAAKGAFDGGRGWDRVHTFAFDRLAKRLSELFLRLKRGEAPKS